MNTLDPEVALKLGRANKRLNQFNLELRKLDNEIIEVEKTLFDA